MKKFFAALLFLLFLKSASTGAGVCRYELLCYIELQNNGYGVSYKAIYPDGTEKIYMTNQLSLLPPEIALQIRDITPTAKNINILPPKNSLMNNNNTPKVEETVGEVFITPTGKKYHRESCIHVRKEKKRINKSQAIELGYLPCKVCNPL